MRTRHERSPLLLCLFFLGCLSLRAYEGVAISYTLLLTCSDSFIQLLRLLTNAAELLMTKIGCFRWVRADSALMLAAMVEKKCRAIGNSAATAAKALSHPNEPRKCVNGYELGI